MYRNEMELPDTTLVSGERSFNAHKMMLCASSLYFRHLFLTQTLVAPHKRGIQKVVLNGFDPEYFEPILNAMYFQPLPKMEDVKTIKSLLSMSYRLQYKGFYEYCCVQYMKKLSETYFLDIWNTAETYVNEEMLNCIPRQLARKFSKVKDSKEFLFLKSSQIISLVEHVEYDCADVIIDSLIRWIKHDPTRTKYLTELFSLIELNLATTAYLSSLVKNEYLIKRSVHVLSTIMGVFSKSGLTNRYQETVKLRRPQAAKPSSLGQRCRMHNRISRPLSQCINN